MEPKKGYFGFGTKFQNKNKPNVTTNNKISINYISGSIFFKWTHHQKYKKEIKQNYNARTHAQVRIFENVMVWVICMTHGGHMRSLLNSPSMKWYFSELEDEDLPESLPDLGPSGDQYVRSDRKTKQSVSMSPTRSSPKERISPRTSGYSSENIK